jgi:hypothetical protein
MAVTRWYGSEIASRVLAASLDAIDEVTADAAAEAKQQHSWEDRAGRLERETISEAASVTREGAAGRFGTTERMGFYGLFLEYKHPFLRPVADRVFPTLPQRLREKL